jgi:hypothetical protein
VKEPPPEIIALLNSYEGARRAFSAKTSGVKEAEVAWAEMIEVFLR